MLVLDERHQIHVVLALDDEDALAGRALARRRRETCANLTRELAADRRRSIEPLACGSAFPTGAFADCELGLCRADDRITQTMRRDRG